MLTMSELIARSCERLAKSLHLKLMPELISGLQHLKGLELFAGAGGMSFIDFVDRVNGVDVSMRTKWACDYITGELLIL